MIGVERLKEVELFHDLTDELEAISQQLAGSYGRGTELSYHWRWLHRSRIR